VAIIQAQEQFYVLTFAVRRACVSAVPTGWISVMFDIEIFMEICREFENVGKVAQKYREFYVRTQIRLIVCCR